MTNKKWTTEEIAYLTKNIDVPTKALAKALNRTESSVQSKKYDLTFRNKKKGRVVEVESSAAPKTEQKKKVDEVKVTTVLQHAVESGKTPYLVLRGGETVAYLQNGEADLDKLVSQGLLNTKDIILEIRKKYVVGVK